MRRPPLTTVARPGRFPLAAALLVAAASASCGGDDQPTVDVLAASSFTAVAEPLEALLEDRLAVDIRFSFGSSGSFLEQLDQGAPAAVVLTADGATMDRIEAAGLVVASAEIVRNELVIVTADTAAGRAIGSLADLAASTDAVIVTCATSAPCGAATDQMLDQSGLTVASASREPNVRATLTKVILGEADAGVVYRTDALSRPELRTVEVGVDNPSLVGRAGVVAGSADGHRILDVLVGADAAKIFVGAGFQAP